MNREGLSKVKRAEFLARLDVLERIIAEQESLVAQRHHRGWDAKGSEHRLGLLRESHRLCLAALLQQLGDRSLEAEPDPESGPGT